MDSGTDPLGPLIELVSELQERADSAVVHSASQAYDMSVIMLRTALREAIKRDRAAHTVHVTRINANLRRLRWFLITSLLGCAVCLVCGIVVGVELAP